MTNPVNANARDNMTTAPGDARARRCAGTAMLFALAIVLSGCGFHLRGLGGQAVLPKSLSRLQLDAGGQGANEPMVALVRDALRGAGAEIDSIPGLPVLKIYGERIDSQVASVRASTGKASEYILQYSVTFALDGAQKYGPDTIGLQRDYSFDPARVVAKEYEERELIGDMRREAAQQIVRRLARSVAAR
jgi:LPS-assembly lipoprotein